MPSHVMFEKVPRWPLMVAVRFEAPVATPGWRVARSSGLRPFSGRSLIWRSVTVVDSSALVELMAACASAEVTVTVSSTPPGVSWKLIDAGTPTSTFTSGTSLRLKPACSTASL